MNAERICRICGKKESEHSIWLVRGDWTHDAEWLKPEAARVEWPAWAKVSEGFFQEFVRKHALAVEDLTEKQLAEAIRQAIACGDFQKLVCTSNNSQLVVYSPFAAEARLQARIKELVEQLRRAGGHCNVCGEYLPGHATGCADICTCG